MKSNGTILFERDASQVNLCLYWANSYSKSDDYEIKLNPFQVTQWQVRQATIGFLPCGFRSLSVNSFCLHIWQNKFQLIGHRSTNLLSNSEVPSGVKSANVLQTTSTVSTGMENFFFVSGAWCLQLSCKQSTRKSNWGSVKEYSPFFVEFHRKDSLQKIWHWRASITYKKTWKTVVLLQIRRIFLRIRCFNHVLITKSS